MATAVRSSGEHVSSRRSAASISRCRVSNPFRLSDCPLLLAAAGRPAEDGSGAVHNVFITRPPGGSRLAAAQCAASALFLQLGAHALHLHRETHTALDLAFALPERTHKPETHR